VVVQGRRQHGLRPSDVQQASDILSSIDDSMLAAMRTAAAGERKRREQQEQQRSAVQSAAASTATAAAAAAVAAAATTGGGGSCAGGSAGGGGGGGAGSGGGSGGGGAGGAAHAAGRNGGSAASKPPSLMASILGKRKQQPIAATSVAHGIAGLEVSDEMLRLELDLYVREPELDVSDIKPEQQAEKVSDWWVVRAHLYPHCFGGAQVLGCDRHLCAIRARVFRRWLDCYS